MLNYRDVTSRPSILNYIAVPPTPIDYAITRTVLQSQAAQYEGKQDANLFDMQNPAVRTVPGQPNAITPTSNATDVFTNAAFSWSNAMWSDNYELQVATDSNFTNIFYENANLDRIRDTVENLDNNVDYFWRVRARNDLGESNWSEPQRFRTVLTDVAEEANSPNKFKLYQNYPNPANPSTTIEYDLAKAGNVNLTLYDILGREVRTLVNGIQASGRHTIVMDARELASGIYLYRLQAGNNVETMKMMLVK